MSRDRIRLGITITLETADVAAAVAALGGAIQQAVLAVTETGVIGNSTYALRVLDDRPRRRRPARRPGRIAHGE